MEPLTARLCSRNEHKRRELARVLPGWRIELLEVEALPPEEAASYYENALAKARFGREVGPPDEWMLGEDSGLEVDFLGGEPGVRSSRWAREGEDPVQKLLSTLEGVGGRFRRARYVCELVALAPDGRAFRGTGLLRGSIAFGPRGSEGFGYDPIFVPDGETRTVAELGNEWKAESSHRARAARVLAAAIAAAGRE